MTTPTEETAMDVRRIIPVAVAAVAITACGASTARPAATANAPGVPGTPTRTITASAEGQASGTPDLLTVSLGVQTTGAQARQTLSTNDAEAQQLIAKLQADGVAGADIQTSQLQINPTYSPPTAGRPPRIVGYTVVDMVTAKLRQLGKAGMLIDDAVAAAGNDAQVSSIAYSIDNDSSLLAAARADAVHQAAARAKAMADAAGVRLGEVRTVTDMTQPALVPAGVASGGAASASPDALPPLQAGSEQLTVDVTVVYDIA
jgi:uncharacterized protein